MSGINEDLVDERVPRTWFWTVEEVCKWVKDEAGFPQYVDCFEKNNIDGRKLVHMTSANLPKIGVYDWKDVKELARGIRMLLTVHVEDWFRSISLAPRESLGNSLL
ncbi:DgyrCDS3119 [Dimorphilus gyrociliatus]|uniref:DgyrCDS3119 n=1 Tax=Dimorphilus gyrociliatus TaxID=2664684 RepID=A0A7I8VE02_9ANNE|nr:DgyrCDS3119 [Dimorphilus gyrociliatus]